MTDKPLFLVVKQRWFELLSTGQKTSEFRSYNDYWCRRLLKAQDTLKDFTRVLFQLGYHKSSPRIMFVIDEIVMTDHICHGSCFEIRLGTRIV